MMTEEQQIDLSEAVLNYASDKAVGYAERSKAFKAGANFWHKRVQVLEIALEELLDKKNNSYHSVVVNIVTDALVKYRGEK